MAGDGARLRVRVPGSSSAVPLLRPDVLGETKGDVMLPLNTEAPDASLTVVMLMTSAWPVSSVWVPSGEFGAGAPMAAF